MKITNDQEYRLALSRWNYLHARAWNHPEWNHDDERNLQALGEAIHQYELTLPEVQELLTTETN